MMRWRRERESRLLVMQVFAEPLAWECDARASAIPERHAPFSASGDAPALVQFDGNVFAF